MFFSSDAGSTRKSKCFPVQKQVFSTGAVVLQFRSNGFSEHRCSFQRWFLGHRRSARRCFPWHRRGDERLFRSVLTAERQCSEVLPGTHAELRGCSDQLQGYCPIFKKFCIVHTKFLRVLKNSVPGDCPPASSFKR